MSLDGLAVNGTGARQGATAPVPDLPRVTAQDAASTPIRGAAGALVRHMEASLSIPTATTMRTFPVASLDAARRVLEAEGRAISASRLIAYAVTRAADAVPGITHRFVRTDSGPQRAVDGAVHLGIAIDVPRPDGTRQVMVPVLRYADQLSLPEFVEAYDELIAAGRAGALSPHQLMGANLILTNTGAFGSSTGVPRLPVGPGAIVAVGTIGYPPGFEEVGAELGVSRICTASSTYDHRVIQGADSGLFLKQFATSLSDPGSALWRDILPDTPASALVAALGSATVADTVPGGAPAPSRVAGAAAVVDALRELHRLRREGYRYALLDPLAAGPVLEADPDEAADRWPGVLTTDVGLAGPARPFAEVYPRLLDAYCGTLAADVSHLRDALERNWWFERVESSPAVSSPAERLEILRRLVAIETLERFMQRVYRGHKTLSVQGLDSTVLMTQALVDLAAEHGLSQVNIGMAHRGRVNVLAHVTGMPYARLLAEFERTNRENAMLPPGSNGDVKQHLGWEGDLEVLPGRQVTVAMLPNPSHLEFVSPVVLGATRAFQDRNVSDGPDVTTGLAILMHGDAAFTGQGVVAETFNMHGLKGYTVGGAVHLVQDNQLGFTTECHNLRSTQWPSDIARGYDVPVLHVNADDPEACVRAARLAFEYRAEFGRDVVLHVLGYRRLGHTETDEPTFTQSRLYQVIAEHRPVVELYEQELLQLGVIDDGTVAELTLAVEQQLRAAHDAAAAAVVDVPEWAPDAPAEQGVTLSSSVDELESLAHRLMEVPEGVTPHAKVMRVLSRRRELLDGEGLVDWAHAELLAFARVAASGRPVRLSGQDVVRGTFTQRHLTLHDTQGSADFSPLLSLPELHGLAKVWPSPLSETAVLAFEYGYSLARPDALAIWEAQFGDFANGGQVIVDQFITGGYAKWGRRSRLTMLLPHGYDGAGPEHSSARIERYLQLSAENNMVVSVPTTPGQYHALLVQQALTPTPRPLIVFTPKSLLRHKSVVSSIDELAPARFSPVLVNRTAAHDDVVRRVLLCTGKIYYELREQAEQLGRDDLAIVRLEQLYPFPTAEVTAALGRFPAAVEVAWVQEEPRNMGAAQHVLEHLAGIGVPGGCRYVGRGARAATAEGYGSTHKRVQAAIVREAVGGETRPGAASPDFA